MPARQSGFDVRIASKKGCLTGSHSLLSAMIKDSYVQFLKSQNNQNLHSLLHLLSSCVNIARSRSEQRDEKGTTET